MSKQKSKNIINLIIFFIILFLAGCKKTKINFKNYRKILKEDNVVKFENNFFKLIIDGIECKMCARSAMQQIGSIDNIEKTEFICPNENFENCYVLIYLKNKSRNIEIEKIKNELKKDGFLLKSIIGEFIGYYFLKDKNIFFEFENLAISSKVKSKIENAIKLNERMLVQGKLDCISNSQDSYLLYNN